MSDYLDRVAPSAVAKRHLFADLGLLAAALVATCRYDALDPGFEVPQVAIGVLTMVLLWLCGAAALNYYDGRAGRAPYDEAGLAAVMVLSMAALIALSHEALSTVIVPADLASFSSVFVCCAVASRLAVFRRRYERETHGEDVLIVGTGALGRATYDELDLRPGHGRVIGHVVIDRDERQSPNLLAPVLGSVAELERVLGEHPVAEVYIAGQPTKQARGMQLAIGACERLGIPFALPAHNFRFDRAQPVIASAFPDGYVHYRNVVSRPYQQACKRFLDILASGAALWALLPFLSLIVLLIKLTSRGPVLFKQVRVGLYGRTFHMLKFRSMVQNAEALRERLLANNEQDGPVFKIRRDPRITAVGRFLRKFSIDELPQLINVLRGEMSLVGPRPPIPSEVAQYEPWQRRRLSVRPGLTCFWQISGRNEISFDEWMLLDMRYVDNWSFGEDLSLILRTVPVVVSGRGAS